MEQPEKTAVADIPEPQTDANLQRSAQQDMAPTPQARGTGIAAALAAAQAQMGRAAKTATNPHFHSRYADLANVVGACMPALSGSGIAVTQPIRREGDQMVLYTVFHHADSDETISDGGLPLIVNKRDMQGLGSAITYARRYGLMAMAGIAPDDDDGNAAAAAPPATITEAQFLDLQGLIEAGGADLGRFLIAYGAPTLEQFPESRFSHARDALLKKVEARRKDNGAANGAGND